MTFFYIAGHVALGALVVVAMLAGSVLVVGSGMWLVERVRWRVPDNVSIAWHYVSRAVLYAFIGVFTIMLLYVLGGGKPLS